MGRITVLQSVPSTLSEDNNRLVVSLQSHIAEEPDRAELYALLFDMARNIDPPKEEDLANYHFTHTEEEVQIAKDPELRAEHQKYARRLVREVKQNSLRIAQQTGEQVAFELYKNALHYESQYWFDSYLIYVEFDRLAKNRFYLPRREQLKEAVVGMQMLKDDRLDRLTISMPPGTGKSTLGTFFLSWLMGLHPDRANLASGYASSMTDSIYKGVHSIITDPEYNWKKVFPHVPLVHASIKASTIDLEKPKRFASLTCRSIDGSITGTTRCHGILYCDDLVEGIEEALSPARLDKKWMKYANDLRSRGEGKHFKEIHVATRWSVHDPIGRIQEEYRHDPRSKFIVMPAVDEKGESNFAYSHDKGFTSAQYKELKRSLDDVSWRALYMNEPIEREGLLYSPDELNRFVNKPPKEERTRTLAVLDPAEGGGDDLVLVIAENYGSTDWYITDVVVSDKDPHVTDNLVVATLIKNNVDMLRVESNAAGSRTADKIGEKLREKGSKCIVTKKPSTANKETRIIVNSADVKNNFFFKSEGRITQGTMYAEYMQKLCSYTMVGKNKHDDCADATSMLVDFIDSFDQGRPVVLRRF